METPAKQPLQLRRAHRAIIELLRPGSAVLDIGSGGGALASHVVTEMGCTLTAVDLTTDLMEYSSAYAKQCVVGSIEEGATWDQIEGKFDYIVFADVLEHLVSPNAVLERCKGSLAEGGCVIASIPNVAYYRVRQDLLLGRFDYGPYGILDRTHLRFFTAKTCRSLFTESGYAVTDFSRVFTSAKNRLLGRAFPNAFTYEFILKASLSL